MSKRLEPQARESLKEHEGLFSLFEQVRGFVPNFAFQLGHRPALLKNFMSLYRTIMLEGSVTTSLKFLVALVSSRVAASSYCQALVGSAALNVGVPQSKIDATHDFENSTELREEEKAALRLAVSASTVPSTVTDEMMTDVKRHYDEGQIVEILATISIFGFLNRWNTTLATPIEESPLEFANEHLASFGWKAGPHVSDAP